MDPIANMKNSGMIGKKMLLKNRKGMETERSTYEKIFREAGENLRIPSVFLE